MLAPDLVGGAAATTRDERRGQALRCARGARADLEGPHEILERSRFVAPSVAARGGGEVRLRGARRLERVRRPGCERRLDLEGHRIRWVRQRRVGERIARRASLAGSARAARPCARAARSLRGPPLSGINGRSVAAASAGLTERDEPARELFAQLWIFTEEQRAPSQASRHVELGAARGERASEGRRGRALRLRRHRPRCRPWRRAA
jgi:hypothetical protein